MGAGASFLSHALNAVDFFSLTRNGRRGRVYTLRVFL